jgi:RNA polymerase sigma factor (sigma-70 family)
MERHQMSDDQLLALFAEGDNSAIEILIQRHKRRIYSHILILVKDKDLAEDFFQDTFVKAIKSIRAGRYQDEGHFVSWIQRIAHNLVIDYFRKQIIKNFRTITGNTICSIIRNLVMNQ